MGLFAWISLISNESFKVGVFSICQALSFLILMRCDVSVVMHSIYISIKFPLIEWISPCVSWCFGIDNPFFLCFNKTCLNVIFSF